MRAFAVLLAALVLPLAAGCGGDDDGAETTGGGGAPAAESVGVSAVEFAFEPADLSVEAGSVTFELSNDGSQPHALAIEELDAATDVIGGGETATLETELEEGTYVIFCPVGDHRDRGMEGTLTVGDGGNGAGGGGDDSAGSGGAGGY